MSASNGGIGAGASSVDEFLQKHNLPPEARDDLQQIVQQITRQQSIKVRVPATTANMGPGFDATGMALDIWNDLTVERAPKFEMNIVGEGADQIPKDETNFVCQGVEAAYEYMGKPVPSLKYSCVNRVPFCRGLGSSSAAVVSGIIAGLALEDHQLTTDTKEELLQIACKIEGHPDNIAPAIYGGMQLGYCTEGLWCTSRLRLPHGIVAVVFVPDHTTETSMARSLLPDTVPRKDAIFNMSRLALLINALSTENYDLLKVACEVAAMLGGKGKDALHQDIRGEKVHFHLKVLIKAALDAGAKAAFLSGAGPCVMALCVGRHGDVFTQTSAVRSEQAVAKAMLAAADAMQETKGRECPGRVLISKPVDYGGHVVAQESDLGANAALSAEKRIEYV